MRTIFSLIVLTLFSSVVFAGGTQTNKPVNFIFTTSDDGAFVYFANNSVGGASCGAGNPNRFAVKPSTPGGRSHLALAMLAFSTGRSVTATGSGNCSVWGDTESLQYLYINP